MHLSRILEISQTCRNSMDIDNYFMPLHFSSPMPVSSPLFPLPLLNFVALLSKNRWVWYAQKDTLSSFSCLGFVVGSLHSCISTSYPHPPNISELKTAEIFIHVYHIMNMTKTIPHQVKPLPVSSKLMIHGSCFNRWGNILL